MNNLLTWPRKLWPEKGSNIVSQTRQRVAQAKRVVTQWTQFYPLLHLEGKNQAGPLQVTFWGRETTRRFYESLLFTDTPSKQEIGQVSFWNLTKAISDSDGDIVIAETDSSLVPKLPDRGAVVLPGFVDQVLDVTGSWEDVRGRFRKNARGEYLRRVRKYGYEYEISDKEEEFEWFYNAMYLPVINQQYGDLSIPMPYRQAQSYFERGWLFVIKREGRFVSGSLCHPEDGVVNFDLIGVLEADQTLLRDGAQGAVYYAMIHWSNQNNYQAVNFLASKPFLKFGLLQHKRQWGAGIVVPATLKRRVWIRIQRNTEAVFQFLQDNPSIIVDDQGQLYGLLVTETPEAALAENEVSWRKHYEMPGLRGLLIRSPDELVAQPTDVITKPEPETSMLFSEYRTEK